MKNISHPFIVCVVGTDTDAGKTAVTAGMARAASQAGLRVRVLKPVQTGCRALPGNGLCAPDVETCREACPESKPEALAVFAAASSPHLAAEREGVRLDVGELAVKVRETAAASGADLVIVEGAGGLMTPLNEHRSFLDFLKCLGAPVLLVAANRLGVLNHALLSVRALRSVGIPISGAVFTSPEVEKSDAVSRMIHTDNPAAFARMSGVPVLAEIPHVPALQAGEAAERLTGWDAVARRLDGMFADPDGVFAAVRQAGDKKNDNAALLRFDREHIWHPYTSALHPLTAYEAVRTNGTRITLRDGTELVDGMASWWCAVHGYNHPALLRALHEQGAAMPHVMFGGLTHEPAVRLAEKLLAIAPAGLKHVFFADSGSVAVEVAMKMALQYQQAQGHAARKTFLSVRGGYHGDTLGAMSVCDPVNGMHTLFQGCLPQQHFAPRPVSAFGSTYDTRDTEALAACFAERGGAVAALIVEPVVQGAGGMWIYHPQYLADAARLCREYGVLLVLDEIATGFGRTGKMFACEWAGVEPDIMCVGKALTGGVLSLAATLASGEVAEGISRGGGVLMHGPTFMGNPLACAVACASLDLLADGEWQEQTARIECVLREELDACRTLPGVADVRVLGAVGVVEMERPVDTGKIQAYFVRQGVWIRPFGRLIYIMPPYSTTDPELALLARAVCGAIAEGEWA